MDITIRLSDNEIKILKKRAKKNMLELREQVEDIVRRSCINAKTITPSSSKCDDRLVDIFSRKKGGKKGKKDNKKDNGKKLNFYSSTFKKRGE